jgi:hypothetical protein
MKKLIFILIIFFCLTSKSFAAGVSFAIPQDVKVGDNFSIVINANTGGELMNSADILVDYNADLVSFAGYKDDDTLIKLWVNAPSGGDGQVHLSGIIPGGVPGLYDANKPGLADVPLVRLLFVAKREGSARFSFIKTEILKNDGKGTALVHDQQNGEVTIKSNSSNNENINNNPDKGLPERFDITFIESYFFSRTPSMIVFSTNDKESGIKEYKIKIGRGEWQDAKSPQPVSRGIFSRNVSIRAYDFYDNFRDSSIIIPGFLSTKLLTIILALLVSCLFVYRVLKYKI